MNVVDGGRPSFFSIELSFKFGLSLFNLFCYSSKFAVTVFGNTTTFSIGFVAIFGSSFYSSSCRDLIGVSGFFTSSLTEGRDI